MNKKYNLGKLDEVDLRTVWPHEAHDFTKWLSEDENLNSLGLSVGMELELVETESLVGSFNVDILARESGTERTVIVENQLEETNHDHLGKIITYAAGKGADVVIWVVKHARDEHRKAIEWLNERTDDDLGFFLVEIELLSIGDSLPAPRFNVVEQPNEWARTIKLSEGLNDTDRIKLSYWTKYHDMAEKSPEFLKVFSPHKPAAQHWSDLSCGSSAYHIALLINTQRNKIGVEFCVSADKEIGRKAIESASAFEDRLDLKAEPYEAKKSSGLRFFKENCKIKGNENAWPGYIKQQLEWALAMREVIDELGL